MGKSSNALRRRSAPSSKGKQALPARGVRKSKVSPKPRQPVRQSYTRFRVSSCKNDVSPAQAKKDLILKVGATGKTYSGNLSAISAFVDHRRKAHGVDLLSLTEDEFILFLYEWKQQGKGCARGVWSALVNLFRANGVKDSFLHDEDVKKAVEGAKANFYPVSKGVINASQNEMLNTFIETCLQEQLGRCTWCAAKGVRNLRRRIRLAKDFMQGVPIRPGNLKDFEVLDMMNDVDPPQVHVRNPKVKGKDKEIVSPGGMEAWKEACGLAENEKIFPRCIDTHLTAVLRGAEVEYGWDQGLVLSTHCLKHTCIQKLEKKVDDAKKNLLCGVGTATRRNHYGKPIEKRGRAQI